MIQLLPSYFSVLKMAASSPTSGLLLYNITWIAESTNANWNVRPCWTKLFTAMKPDWKSKLQVFHSCDSAPKVVEHQIGLCFRWDGLSRPAKRLSLFYLNRVAHSALRLVSIGALYLKNSLHLELLKYLIKILPEF